MEDPFAQRHSALCYLFPPVRGMSSLKELNLELNLQAAQGKEERHSLQPWPQSPKLVK